MQAHPVAELPSHPIAWTGRRCGDNREIESRRQHAPTPAHRPRPHGDEEALDIIEHFIETVEATLPAHATIVKTIGDEVMVVSTDSESLAEWAVGLLTLFTERPQPRVGLHRGSAVLHEGDYFGHDVNLAHRVVNRALAGEVIGTQSLVDEIGRSQYLEFEPIGEVTLKGVPEPVELFVITPVRG